MPYPQYLKDLMKKCEANRAHHVEMKKVDDDLPFLTLEQRQEYLDNYHPDYKTGPDIKRPIKIGVSKDYSISPEIVDLIECRALVEPERIDLSEPDYDVDVLVIGGGGAGSNAAIYAKQAGADVMMVTKLRHGDANTMMAEGGIQACDKPEKDSPFYHFLDVMGGGHFVNKPSLVRRLVEDGPDAIRYLNHLGCMFDKFEDGRMKSVHGGGTSRKRMHSASDMSGAEIMRVLRDEVRNLGIPVVEFTSAVELIKNADGQCAGAVLFNMETEEFLICKAKAVVMATGGSGRLHMQNFMTTNHYGATGDGLIMSYRAGVPLTFLHTIQYHPTGVAYPEQAEGILITEKFRGAGANVLNVDGERFVNEREPRDIESSSFIREATEVGKGVPTPKGTWGIWLDSPMLEMLHGEGYVEKNFCGAFMLLKRFGIDISREPMLVYPTLHYQNGGVDFEADASTCLPGLYMAGEVAGGIHGENRLMGNSLLDINVFGRVAGTSSAKFAKETATDTPLNLDHVVAHHKELEEAGIVNDRTSPCLLPDYTPDAVKAKQLATRYMGNYR